LKLKWTKRALRQLIHAQDYIAKDNPAAAQAVAERIADAARLLPTQP
jgi:plasmid stabilization system protein ParE